MPRPKATPVSTLARFTSKYLVLPNGCWEWQRGKSPKGYGDFHDGSKSVRAHRWAYEHFVGQIPDGLVLDHLCRNHSCVNPAHLESVTIKENLARGIQANAIKTHCRKGHAFTTANTLMRPNGSRACRTCVYASNLRGYYGRRERSNGAA